MSLDQEINRRRTFAIISHPDAGKTTLSEKLLLYGQAIQTAGLVTKKANRKHTVSDWMGIEQERGISISSSALQFTFNDIVYNLLDTPGHGDFSEDTYRTLMAVDSAIMLIDAVKGVEPQTIKLFKVCRERGIPIFTFFNKMDRPSKNPFDLLEEVEEVLGVLATPLTWPVGPPGGFRGVLDRSSAELHLYERTAGGQWRSPTQLSSLKDPQTLSLLGETDYQLLRDELEMVETLLHPFDEDSFAEGEITPVFFGCAINNFGLDHFLETFTRLAPSPRPLNTLEGPVNPKDDAFNAFVYKVQANINPAHRDRMAFIRVASGIFEKEMTVRHQRSGKKVKLNYSYRLFGQRRETIDRAYPGDIVGLVNPGIFRVGDVLTTGQSLNMPPFPRFAPEIFALAHLSDQTQAKAFRKGLAQLGEEGVVQVFSDPFAPGNASILAAVGQLQLEVFQERMREEYRCDVRLESLPYTASRWISGPLKGPEFYSFKLLHDEQDRPIALFRNPWHQQQCESKDKELLFSLHPPDAGDR
jgi:peptide chain release factor 3